MRKQTRSHLIWPALSDLKPSWSMFPGTESPAMTEGDLTRQARWVKESTFFYKNRDNIHKQLHFITWLIIPRVNHEKTIQLLLISPEAGRYFGMLDSTVTTILFLGPKLDEDVDGEGWRNRVSQYKGKLRRTKWSYIPCYDDLSLLPPSSFAFLHSIHH